MFGDYLGENGCEFAAHATCTGESGPLDGRDQYAPELVNTARTVFTAITMSEIMVQFST